jgi:CHC2 zinc finger
VNARIDFAPFIAAHPISAFCRSRGIELKKHGELLVAECPFHQEKTGSFTVYPDDHFFCFGCEKHGHVVYLCAELDGISLAAAAEKLGGQSTDTGPAHSPKKLCGRAEKEKVMWMPEGYGRPTRADLRRLSTLRSISVAALEIAVHRAFLWCFDHPRNGRCWLFTDRRRKCAFRRRLDGQNFELRNGARTKVASCKGSDTTGPMCYEEAKNFPCFAIVEGAPNGLAVIAQALASGVEQRVAPIVMPHAGSKFTEASLACLKGKRARIFPDDDPPGRGAAALWAKQLKSAGIVVDAYSFDGLIKSDGKAVRDINDLCQISPDSEEKYCGVLDSLMDFAQQPEGIAHAWDV